MEARFRAGGADGFNIMPPTLPGGLDDFSPLEYLQRAGP
jgi:alkanesulfonate monooxygenase SsuD/methylene tetrahydromethanopterin reductase-like flavin-dependent oxidoreductase (luciferase family)